MFVTFVLPKGSPEKGAITQEAPASDSRGVEEGFMLPTLCLWLFTSNCGWGKRVGKLPPLLTEAILVYDDNCERLVSFAPFWL